MAWPEDYFLPAKGILADSPVDSGTHDHYKISALQLEGLRLMLNERLSWCLGRINQTSPLVRAFADIPPFDTPIIRKAPSDPTTPLAILQTNLISAASYFIDWDRFPSGDISGCLVPTSLGNGLGWNSGPTSNLTNDVSALLDYLGMGVIGAYGRTVFTGEPARNPFGRAASTNFTIAYKEHINELYECLQCMTYVRMPGLQRDLSGGLTGSCRIGGGSTQVAAETNYAASGYSFQDGNIGMQTYVYGGWYSTSSCPGKLYYDFSGMSISTAAKIFISLRPFYYEDQYSPPVAVDQAWHLFDTVASPSGVYTSPALGADSMPPFISGGLRNKGWRVGAFPEVFTGGVAIFAPTFAYP